MTDRNQATQQKSFKDAEVQADDVLIEIHPSVKADPTHKNIYADNLQEHNTAPRQDSIELCWKNVTIKNKDGKVLLDNISGRAKGRVLAIMGPSGAGKSTLLNYLSRRMDMKMATGESYLGGKKDYTKRMLKFASAYVMQDDLLFGNLTVYETISYLARLRLPKTYTSEMIEFRVEEVLNKLGLHKCRQTIVGDAMHKGISGGERKRLSTAIELLNKPGLLFLDEPTSGLDSVNAFGLVQILKRQAVERNCTVICTIHQPTVKTFGLYDDVLVLERGRLVYHGPVSEVTKFYEAVGFPCPVNHNVAEHILDIITPFSREDNQIIFSNADKLVGAFEGYASNHPKWETRLKKDQQPIDQELDKLNRIKWSKQFSVLYERSFKTLWRDKFALITNLIQTSLMALLIGTAFFEIGKNTTSQTRRQPLLFFCVINQGIFSALQVINSFPHERAIILRERAAGSYNVSSYFVSKVLSEILISLIYPPLFVVIVYFLSGLDRTVSKFFVFLAFMWLGKLAALSMAMMVASIARRVSLALVILPLTMEITRLFGGFFLAPINLPVYFSWLDAICYVKYTYIAVSLNELRGLELTCTAEQIQNDLCKITRGEQVIKNLGLDFIEIYQCALVLLGLIFGCLFIAYVFIRTNKKK